MPAIDPAQDSLYETVDFLSEVKSRAESRVKLARALLADGDITTRDLRRLELHYGDARASVNAGLDRILTELEVGRNAPVAESYEMAADRAAEQIVDFLTLSDDLILSVDRAVTPAVIEIGKMISSALVGVWKTIRGEKQERRAALLRRVEGLKWAAFDEVMPLDSTS